MTYHNNDLKCREIQYKISINFVEKYLINLQMTKNAIGINVFANRG